MIELITTIIFLQINLYRIDQGLLFIPESPETCEYAEYRLQQIATDFSHDKFYGGKTEGIWYENLGRVTKKNGDFLNNALYIIKLWKHSPTHDVNLRTDMTSMCFRTDGIHFVMSGIKKK